MKYMLVSKALILGATKLVLASSYCQQNQCLGALNNLEPASSASALCSSLLATPVPKTQTVGLPSIANQCGDDCEVVSRLSSACSCFHLSTALGGARFPPPPSTSSLHSITPTYPTTSPSYPASSVYPTASSKPSGSHPHPGRPHGPGACQPHTVYITDLGYPSCPCPPPQPSPPATITVTSCASGYPSRAPPPPPYPPGNSTCPPPTSITSVTTVTITTCTSSGGSGPTNPPPPPPPTGSRTCNSLLNGGFEASDTSGWTPSPSNPVDQTSVVNAFFEGEFAYAMAAPGSGLQQTFAQCETGPATFVFEGYFSSWGSSNACLVEVCHLNDADPTLVCNSITLPGSPNGPLAWTRGSVNIDFTAQKLNYTVTFVTDCGLLYADAFRIFPSY